MAHCLLKILSWLYGLAVWIRGFCYDQGWLRSRSFHVPVVCVGNLAVGGTGKTPHTEYLIRLLQSAGLQVATLSRGYRRHTRGFVLATATSTAAEVGDEPAQMKGKFPDATVAVCEDRCRGIDRLLAMEQAPEVILLDDAYQHRRVSLGLSILLTDCRRPFCSDDLLPAGRLREPAGRGKRRAQVVVVTKCPPRLSEEERADMARRLDLLPGQKLYFSTLLYRTLQPVFPGVADNRHDHPMPQASEAVLLVTGIASPAQLAEEVGRHSGRVVTLAFADHHDFSERDLRSIAEAFDALAPQPRLIITTEKDAVRLRHHPRLPHRLKPHLYVLPIEVGFLFDEQQSFNQYIIDYVSTHTRDRRIPPRADAHCP